MTFLAIFKVNWCNNYSSLPYVNFLFVYIDVHMVRCRQSVIDGAYILFLAKKDILQSRHAADSAGKYVYKVASIYLIRKSNTGIPAVLFGALIKLTNGNTVNSLSCSGVPSVPRVSYIAKGLERITFSPSIFINNFFVIVYSVINKRMRVDGCV